MPRCLMSKQRDGKSRPLGMEGLRLQTQLPSAVCVVPQDTYLLCAYSSICEMGIIMLIPGTAGAAGELHISGEVYQPRGSRPESKPCFPLGKLSQPQCSHL